jgi:hypothetical protein
MLAMALPSSPPLLPEADNADSPLFAPADSDDLLPIRPSLAAGSLKRQYSDYASLSSDPVFSEGTSEAEEEEGADEQPRRKRLVRGPWWCVISMDKSYPYLRRLLTRGASFLGACAAVWRRENA